MLKPKGSHKRVKYYKVTRNERYNHFPVGRDLIFETALRFVWKENGHEYEKIIPTEYWIKNVLKLKKLIYYDPKILERVYKGDFYVVDENSIFNY